MRADDLVIGMDGSIARVTVIGAGLAGSECAWQLAERGVHVRLFEQKPEKKTPAQYLDGFAELVCSNSFRGVAVHNAVGLLKEEMRRAGSLVMKVGEQTRVPAGGAFAVDRERFSEEITRQLVEHKNIEVVHDVVKEIPTERPLVIATGPLTAPELADALGRAVGTQYLAYYDAIAPIVSADSIAWDRVFKASRYDKGQDDAYVNCPLDETQYQAFVQALLDAEKVEPKSFEEVRYFEGCLPIEVMASRGPKTLSFGCMKPVGLTDPRTGRWPHAVVQLRAEHNPPTAYNLVGFQTRMKWPEQKRVFAMIPGLEHAEYERYGSVHRNTFLNSPMVLDDSLALQALPGVYVAGQLSGVEGYIESAAMGLVIGLELGARLLGQLVIQAPPSTALGGLRAHLRTKQDDFQPKNVMWSMFPPLEGQRLGKRQRKDKKAERALADLGEWLLKIKN